MGSGSLGVEMLETFLVMVVVSYWLFWWCLGVGAGYVSSDLEQVNPVLDGAWPAEGRE